MITQPLLRGQKIAKANQVRRIDSHSYIVKFQASNNEYDVLSTELGWICSCPTTSLGASYQSILG